jgi:hypothetical protein
VGRAGRASYPKTRHAILPVSSSSHIDQNSNGQPHAAASILVLALLQYGQKSNRVFGECRRMVVLQVLTGGKLAGRRETFLGTSSTRVHMHVQHAHAAPRRRRTYARTRAACARIELGKTLPSPPIIQSSTPQAGSDKAVTV